MRYGPNLAGTHDHPQLGQRSSCPGSDRAHSSCNTFQLRIPLKYNYDAMYGSSAHLAEVYAPQSSRRIFSETQAVGSTDHPGCSPTYNGLKVRFSATLGRDTEIELGLG
jgi:hypothetical protein